MNAAEKRSPDETVKQKIEQRAYEIWESEGCPYGRDFDHWLRAEAEITTSLSESSTPGGESQSTPVKSRAKQ